MFFPRVSQSLTLQNAKLALRSVGITINKKHTGEYRVNFVGGAEETAYYTDDMQDAVDTGFVMADPKALDNIEARGIYAQ